ncbi:MAG: hypothetical protein Q9173_006866 [Seirophora scorigena]
MANFINWAFPCFGIGHPDSPKETAKKGSPRSGPREKRLGPNGIPYLASMARPMYYLGDPPKLKNINQTNQNDGVAHLPGQGVVGAGIIYPEPERKSLHRSNIQDGTNKTRVKQARLGLRVSIPPSQYTAPPVEKSRLSPDGAENQQALERANLQGESVRGKGVGPPRRVFFPSPATPVTKSAFSATSTVAFDTPTMSGRRSHGTNKPRKVNLGDELALFSITSNDGELSVVSTHLSTKSAKAITALHPSELKSSELKSSIHDFAHEKHRDGRHFLPPAAVGS